jgi:hypothetical protein
MNEHQVEEWVPYLAFNRKIANVARIKVCKHACVLDIVDTDAIRASITFPKILDFRYSIENGFIDRLSTVKIAKEDLYQNDILIAYNSKYLEHFTQRASQVVRLENLQVRHYLIFDRIDTGVEILTSCEPLFSYAN